MPRKCTICTHTDLKAINKAIVKGQSFRGIALQFALVDMSIARHVENCLAMEVSAIIQGHRASQAVDVVKEFTEQLSFAKRLREAAENWLLVDGEIDLDARATEVMVVYDDHLDRTGKGEPKQKKLALNELLLIATTDAREPTFAVVKTMDLRKFANDTIDATDKCIDRFAKLGGLYQREGMNTGDLERAVKSYHSWMDRYPDASNEDREMWLGWFADGAHVSKVELQRHIGVVEIGGVQ